VIAIDAVDSRKQSKTRLVQRLTAGWFCKNEDRKRGRRRRFTLQPETHEQGQDYRQPNADGETPGADGNPRYSERLLCCCRDHGNASVDAWSFALSSPMPTLRQRRRSGSLVLLR
jgi:hypothetical protein